MNIMNTPTPADPGIQAQREAFYSRAATQSLAPLWTRLSALRVRSEIT